MRETNEGLKHEYDIRDVHNINNYQIHFLIPNMPLIVIFYLNAAFRPNLFYPGCSTPTTNQYDDIKLFGIGSTMSELLYC